MENIFSMEFARTATLAVPLVKTQNHVPLVKKERRSYQTATVLRKLQLEELQKILHVQMEHFMIKRGAVLLVILLAQLVSVLRHQNHTTARPVKIQTTPLSEEPVPVLKEHMPKKKVENVMGNVTHHVDFVMDLEKENAFHAVTMDQRKIKALVNVSIVQKNQKNIQILAKKKQNRQK